MLDLRNLVCCSTFRLALVGRVLSYSQREMFFYFKHYLCQTSFTCFRKITFHFTDLAMKQNDNQGERHLIKYRFKNTGGYLTTLLQNRKQNLLHN